MLASVVEKSKKWWVLALVALLVLALTSCSKKRAAYSEDTYYEPCQGTIGTFDVYLLPTERIAMYELVMVVGSLNNPGDIVKIALTSENQSYRIVVPETDLQLDQEISLGYVTDSDLNFYDSIAVVPSDPSQLNETPLTQQNEADALCAIPISYSDGIQSSSNVY